MKKYFLFLLLAFISKMAFAQPANCGVTLYTDSTFLGMVIAADPTGTAPFTYLWNTGQTSPTVQPNGTNLYCVTITDATGCTASGCIQPFGGPCNSFSIYIQSDPATGLTAIAQGGTQPYLYTWSNGETTPSIFPNSTGQYCCNVTDANGCSALDCYGTNPGGDSTCWVSIASQPVSNIQTAVIAYGSSALGNAPTGYLWSTGEATSTIMVSQTGAYCVTATFPGGCTSSTCQMVVVGGGGGWDSCYVEITQSSPGSPTSELTAYLYNAAGLCLVANYEWNTGETSATITVTQPGSYCVTVTSLDGTCSEASCLWVGPNVQGYPIQGYVFPMQANVPAIGTVTLYQVTTNPGPYPVYATTSIYPDSNGTTGSYYYFGNIPPGEYIIKAEVDPASAGAAIYEPTYFGNVLYWDLATVVTLPNYPTSAYHITLIEDGFTGGGGNGSIWGKVTKDPNFGSNGNGAEGNGGDPIEHAEVLLLDSQDQPLAFQFTGADGNFTFGGLNSVGPFKVLLEIAGLEQAWYIVTLDGAIPIATGLDFLVSNSAISTGILDLAKTADLAVSPNPVKNTLRLTLGFELPETATLQILNSTGSEVLLQTLAANQRVVELDLAALPGGVYFLNLTDGKNFLSKKLVKE